MKLALLGKDIGHSFSPDYFKKKFEELALDHHYQLLDIPDLKQLKSKIKELKLDGFNVTIPYKQEIIHHLDHISKEAAAANAVNVVKVVNGKMSGFNTDIPAFTQTIFPFAYKGLNALIFGTGGSSKAIQFALSQLGIEYNTVGRSSKADFAYTDLHESRLFEKHRLLINCTPVGMHGRDDQVLLIPFEDITKSHTCYDLIYNPPETPFLKKARIRGAKTINGLNMLQLQADLSWEIWKS